MARITDPWRARRLARVLFSDISAYAGDQVRIGIEKDDLLQRLSREIEQGRTWFRAQVDLPESDRIFNWALVDVLVYGNRRVASHIW